MTDYFFLICECSKRMLIVGLVPGRILFLWSFSLEITFNSWYMYHIKKCCGLNLKCKEKLWEREKKSQNINIFKWIYLSAIWIQVLNMNQEEEMVTYYWAITQLMYPCKRWCWWGGGCFDPLSVCMCNNGIIWYHSSLIMKIKM